MEKECCPLSKIKSQLIQLYGPKDVPVAVREFSCTGQTFGPHSWISWLQVAVFFLYRLHFAILYYIYYIVLI